jgi:uncharacterized DUF497 family protein
MRFEWDENKRWFNLRKHGIDFADIISAFDSDMYVRLDERFDYGEIRYLSLGLFLGEVVAISHTESDEVIRIISARKAEDHEQEIYFKNIRD